MENQTHWNEYVFALISINKTEKADMGGEGGWKERGGLWYKLFVSVFMCSTPCNSDTLLQHKDSSHTVSKCQAEVFLPPSASQIYYSQQAALVKHNLDTITQLISSFLTTQSITAGISDIWFDFSPHPWPNAAFTTQCEVWFPSTSWVEMLSSSTWCDLVVILVTIINVRK